MSIDGKLKLEQLCESFLCYFIDGTLDNLVKENNGDLLDSRCLQLILKKPFSSDFTIQKYLTRILAIAGIVMEHLQCMYLVIIY